MVSGLKLEIKEIRRVMTGNNTTETRTSVLHHKTPLNDAVNSQLTTRKCKIFSLSMQIYGLRTKILSKLLYICVGY